MDKLKSVHTAYCTFDLDKKLNDRTQQRKLAALECNRINNAMKLAKKNKEIKEKEKERHIKAETEVIELTVLNEVKQNETTKQLEKEAMSKFLKEHKQLKKEKLESEKVNDKLTEVIRVEQDKKQCKIKQIVNESHKNYHESEQYKKNYKLIELAKENEEKRYDFIDKRIKDEEKRLVDVDEENLEKKKKKLQERIAQAELNKTVGQRKQKPCEDDCVNVSYQQCLIPPYDGSSKDCNYQKNSTDEHKLGCPNLGSELLREQSKRGKEECPWTGATTTNKRFAAEENKIASECLYDLPVKKVIDNYKRLNALDSLPSNIELQKHKHY